jgi:hypothetical protein
MVKNIFDRTDFINCLEFICDSINNYVVTKDTKLKCREFYIYNNDGIYTPIVTYKIVENYVKFYDIFTGGEIFRFIYDNGFNCYYFDSSFLSFEVDDGPFYDFLLDILNNLI